MVIGFAAGGTVAAALAGSGSGLADAATTALWALVVAGGFAITILIWGLRRPAPLPWLWVVIGWGGALLAVLALIQRAPVRQQDDATPAVRQATVPATTPVVADTVRTDSIIALAPPSRAADSMWLSHGVVARTAPSTSAASIATISTIAELERRELGYEEVAILVRAHASGWLKVSLEDGRRGWIAVPDDQPVIPVDSILPRSLSYLTLAWDRRLRASPQRAQPAVRVPGIDPGEDETPVEILASRRNADGLWWQVRVLEYSPCEGTDTPPTAAEGWIPAWQDAVLTAEWYSRGC